MNTASTIDEFVSNLQSAGWSEASAVLVDAPSMEIEDIELWQVAYDEPTVLLFMRRNELTDESLRRDAQRICRLTPARSMVLVSAGIDDGRWALSVCPTWKEKTRILSGDRGELRVWEADCLEVFERTQDCLEAAIRLTNLLDKKETTHAFFRAVREQATKLDRAWLAPTPLAGDDRRELTILLLCRLLFVYFLERKRWLSDKPGWVARTLLARSEGGEGTKDSIWTDRLRPLFFDVLNRPSEARVSDRWKTVPYLNGGLFDLTPTEAKHPDVTLPDAALEELILTVFEKYRFVDSEVPDERAAVDPEMLGIIFEQLMNRNQRSQSGAFFTPPSVARKHVEDTMEAWLDHEDTSSERSKLNRLRSIRILDPACGSGTFLLSALFDLEKRLSALGETTNQASLRRRIVTENLYGVDVSPLAVRVTELRLWLALIDCLPDDREEDPPPLPNLSFQLVAGDFLEDEGRSLVSVRANAKVAEALSAREEARKRYASAHAAGAKAEARQATERCSRNLGLALVDAWLDSNSPAERQESLIATTAENEGGFQDISARRREEVAKLRSAFERGWRGGAFCSAFHFSSVIAEGGFDLVVGNPPWVRWTELPPPTREQLRKHYRVLQPGSGGMHTGQPDLCYAFVERSLTLAKPGGVVGFLLSAKLLRSSSAFELRRFLGEHVRILEIDDYSGRGEKVFDADTYTLFLQLKNEAPSPVDQLRVRTETGHLSVRQRDLIQFAGRPGSPWLLPATASGLRRLENGFANGRGVTIAHTRAVRYGAKTGLNEVFVDPPRGLPHVLAAVRGRDIRDGAIVSTSRLLVPHDLDSAEPLAELDEPLEHYLLPHKPRLLARSDLRGEERWWQIFRLRPDAFGHRVAWPDIARRLDPVYLPPVSEGGPVAMNSVYYFAVDSRDEAMRWVRWLRSEDVQELATLLADAALSGYRRFRSTVIGRLPAEPSVVAHLEQTTLFSEEV